MKYYYFTAKDMSGITCAGVGKFKNKAELLDKMLPKLVLNIIELTKEEYDELENKHSKPIKTKQT